MLDTKKEKKDDMLMVRLTSKEKKIIKALSIASGETIGEYFLRKLYSTLSEKEKKLIQAMEQQEGL